MGDTVNLRQFRKQKARADKAKAADQNRARHGRSKADKQRDDLERQNVLTFIEGHRRQPAADRDKT